MDHRKPAENPRDLLPDLKFGQRLLGLDVGAKTIGIALSDVGHIIASPTTTIRRTKFRADVAELKALVEEHEIGALIIGMPFNMDGTEGPRCQSVRQFAVNVLEVIDIPAALWDERLSTVTAERALLEADMSRKRRAEVIDKMAAAVILQSALDMMSY